MSQASFYMNNMSLAMAQSTIYQNQLRMASTMLVPLNARLEALNGVAVDEDDESQVTVTEDLEDDTL